ncbi:MAG: hypothetical protein HEQ25_08045 [Dolichospermum sp. DET73]|nr:hypothetical protein [Dolichospermum sp. DET73]
MNNIEKQNLFFTELSDEDAASISGGGWWEDTKKEAQRWWDGMKNTRKVIQIGFGLYTGRLIILPPFPPNAGNGPVA